MQKPVLIIQNDIIDTPGTLLNVLESRGIVFDIVKPYEGESIPEDLDSWSGLIVLGGPQAAYEADIYPYLNDEMALMRASIDANKPLLGICLGAQLLAAALGASVYLHTVKEIGWKPITLTNDGQSDPLLIGLGHTLTLLEWHGDTFDLPEGAQLLATSEVCKQQCIKFGEKAYGIQFHLEAEEWNINTLVESFPESMTAGGTDAKTLLSDTQKYLPGMVSLAHTIFGRWVDLLA